MMASIVDTGERGSDTNGGDIKDQDRGVPEELLVRRSALSEGGRIETVINIKISTTGTNDTHIPSVVTSSLSLSLSPGEVKGLSDSLGLKSRDLYITVQLDQEEVYRTSIIERTLKYGNNTVHT